MGVTGTVRKSIQEEEDIFNEVKVSLRLQIENAQERLVKENHRARALTKQIHETQRADDKALLASDEAVSHGLKDGKKAEIEKLVKQVKHPYFARIKVAEERDRGTQHTIEYKLGFSANIDLRIIDWRKAPISKLYYEYKEGEEYIEEILGRERIGKVLLRNRVDVSDGSLVGIENRHGRFQWNPELAEWEDNSQTTRTGKTQHGQLPEVLSLITPEQFESITVDADSAILIQGIAGSGKTTVALHRLSWLLHEDNAGLNKDRALCLVRSPILRAYIENSLPSVDLEGLKTLAYHEWSCRLLLSNDKKRPIERPDRIPPLHIRRFKRSFQLLQTLEDAGQFTLDSRPLRTQLEDILLKIVKLSSDRAQLNAPSEFTAQTINEAYEHMLINFESDTLDWEDDALLLRILQLSNKGEATTGTWDHIMVDEVQDLSPVELATIVASVKSHKSLTLVGDTSQSLDPTNAFPGWKELCKRWSFTDDMSRYISLEVSHRSTLPIMRLADHVQGYHGIRKGRPGRTPIWFRCKNEAQGVEYALKWLNKATTLYPNALVAVLCPTMKQAYATYRLLEPTFQNTVRLGEQSNFSFDNGIIVTEVTQVKGLEFHSVLIWNPSRKDYPADHMGRNSLYVAITRAEENLCIVNWSLPSKGLPDFHSSSLIRRQDVALWSEEDASNGQQHG
jgi:DNA helicase IV